MEISTSLSPCADRLEFLVAYCLDSADSQGIFVSMGKGIKLTSDQCRCKRYDCGSIYLLLHILARLFPNIFS